jgi:hypothetical protein
MISQKFVNTRCCLHASAILSSTQQYKARNSCADRAAVQNITISHLLQGSSEQQVNALKQYAQELAMSQDL